MTRILILGARGQVGSELTALPWPDAVSVTGLARDQVDLTDRAALRAQVMAMRPDVVINAAAYTAVDKAESEADLTFAVNRDAPETLADACAALGARLLHISTDYVFDGSKFGAYVETDPVAPLGVYGRSKEAGESAIRAHLADHVILRTAWVFGATGGNFVKTMLRFGHERRHLRVVGDQVGCPTPARAIAEALARIALTNDTAFQRGTYHFAGNHAVSWFQFAEAIFAAAARYGVARPRLDCITTAEYPTPARRPANSVLSCDLLAARYDIAPANWQAGLEAVLADLAQAGTLPGAGLLARPDRTA